MSSVNVVTESTSTVFQGNSTSKHDTTTIQTQAQADLAATVQISADGRMKAQLYSAGNDPFGFANQREAMMRMIEEARAARGLAPKTYVPTLDVNEPSLAPTPEAASAATATVATQTAPAATAVAPVASATPTAPTVSEKIAFTYQASPESVINTYTYEKYEDTYLRNIEDDHNNSYGGWGLREGYYHYLFLRDGKAVNDVLDKGYYNVTLSGDNYRTTDSVLARYEELREEAKKAFGHDSNLLEKNLASLDWAFQRKMGDLANNLALQMDYERQTAQYGWHSDYTAFEGHKLGTNKNFNYEEFSANSMKMMQEFAKSYTAQIKGGSSYGNAREIALAMMSAMFNKTTSVNNLSFDDFMILEKYSMANVDVNSVKAVSDWLAKRDQLNKQFNSSTEISEELRKLLDM